MKNKDVIILNGVSYNLVGGQLVNLSGPATLLEHHNIKLAKPRSNQHHISRHKAQKSTTLRREGLDKPHKALAKNITAKSTRLSAESSKGLSSKHIAKSVFVRKFASSHKVLVKKTHNLPVARPLKKQLAHHIH